MSTKDVSDGQFDEETGLNLFDDTASAAGSFTHSMWGYDRTSVDNYVREIEQQVSTLKQLTRHLRGRYLRPRPRLLRVISSVWGCTRPKS